VSEGGYPYIPPSRLAEVAGETADMLTKFGDKINKQMIKRGWTKESVNQTINNPSKLVKTTDTRFNPDGSKNSEPATAYLNQDGSYVVRNDNTGDIVQVSNRKDPNWKSPFGE